MRSSRSPLEAIRQLLSGAGRALPTGEKRPQRFLELLAKNRTKKDERELLALHLFYCDRRFRQMPRSYFPSFDDGAASRESLGYAAYEYFRAKKHFSAGKGPATAFEAALERGSSAIGFLYSWRTAALVSFLRHTGSPMLRALRNVRIHLREGRFRVMGKAGLKNTWWPGGWVDDDGSEPLDLFSAPKTPTSDPSAHKRAVFDAVHTTLTPAEFGVLSRHLRSKIDGVAGLDVRRARTNAVLEAARSRSGPEARAVRGYTSVGRFAGERLWAPDVWRPKVRAPNVGLPELVVAKNARGKAALRQLCLEARLPLTRSEIAVAFVRSGSLEANEVAMSEGSSNTIATPPIEPTPHLKKRVGAFYDALDETERAVLAHRVKGESWAAIALALAPTSKKKLGGERYRQLFTVGIQDRLRRTFDDPEEWSLIIDHLERLCSGTVGADQPGLQNKV